MAPNNPTAPAPKITPPVKTDVVAIIAPAIKATLDPVPPTIFFKFSVFKYYSEKAFLKLFSVSAYNISSILNSISNSSRTSSIEGFILLIAKGYKVCPNSFCGHMNSGKQAEA
jgi:hypothetical protein